MQNQRGVGIIDAIKEIYNFNKISGVLPAISFEAGVSTIRSIRSETMFQ
jgi:hypothetical protein